MKLTLCLAASLFALLALPLGARAATHDGPVNPYANLDPDGVPLAVTQGDEDSSTSKEAAALEKQQADQEFRSRNWLLLEYEQQFRHNTGATTPDRTINMYLQLSMNKNLAAVSNDSTIDGNAETPAPPLHATPQPHSNQNGVSLRPDSTPGKYNFAPLVSPYNSSAASSASQPFYAGAYSAALPSSLSPNSSLGGTASESPASTPAPAPRSSISMLPPSSPTETVDLQTPGMTADKSNPSMPNLDLDSLPDPSTPDPQNQQEPPELPELKQPLDEEQLHQVMNVKLAPAQPLQASMSSQKKAQPTVAAQPAPPPQETPEPINKQPQLSPIHAPLSSPFDVFNH